MTQRKQRSQRGIKNQVLTLQGHKARSQPTTDGNTVDCTRFGDVAHRLESPPSSSASAGTFRCRNSSTSAFGPSRTAGGRTETAHESATQANTCNAQAHARKHTQDSHTELAVLRKTQKAANKSVRAPRGYAINGRRAPPVANALAHPRTHTCSECARLGQQLVRDGLRIIELRHALLAHGSLGTAVLLVIAAAGSAGGTLSSFIRIGRVVVRLGVMQRTRVCRVRAYGRNINNFCNSSNKCGADQRSVMPTVLNANKSVVATSGRPLARSLPQASGLFLRVQRWGGVGRVVRACVRG